MPDITLRVNGAARTVNTEADTPLQSVLRNDLELNGAKYGCGQAQCGACTVMIDGNAIFTFSDVPKVEVHLINRPDERSPGTGEGAQGPAVGAIAIAIANATGKRLRDLPFTPEKVRAAYA